jgi:broad specificity phosphatase PhoE
VSLTHRGDRADKSSACRIHVVRHGTTRLNLENRYRGRREVPLDNQGWSDARFAAERLAGAELAAVYSGPLRRTLDTAYVIAKRAGGIPVYPLPGLVNLDYGAWEGLTAQEATERDPRAFRLYCVAPEMAVCPGGEGLTEAADRVLIALEAIARQHPGQAVAAVTHAAVVRLAVAKITGRMGPGWRISLPTGCITVVEAAEGALSVPLRDNASNWILDLRSLESDPATRTRSG